ncbi:hypothetical protein [Labedaea rhizosphaerae]|jgi:hypothetical protein|uniref:Uncharacterized protein n=1 Tax=Labedaea rhizosphaerae TaxID=598644 RepID=A0A4V3CYZ4_LABRH|nr:hypothetical protein [Labedaea rhizosphaerae]TDP96048.1 hypothetical protein EV186_10428 [Labedaea rhizosphaerae]
MIGSRGRVTGTIGPGLIGEVLISVRGGVEAFYAYPADPDTKITIGTQVLVVDFDEPNTVYVEPWRPTRLTG